LERDLCRQVGRDGCRCGGCCRERYGGCERRGERQTGGKRKRNLCVVGALDLPSPEADELGIMNLSLPAN
jgi:hypothetical protein